MKQGLLIIIMIFSIPLNAIALPMIDATTDQTMKKTIDIIRASLPENKREAFNDALKAVMFSQIDMGDLIASGSSGVNLVEGKMKQALHGKTGDEVIALAAQIKKKNQQQMRSQELTELQALEKKRIKAETAKKELAKFETLEARYYKKKYEVMGEIIQPIIEMTVKNGTQYAISRAYFIGTLKSPNRSIPWLREDFNYAIDGGVEPGETATWPYPLTCTASGVQCKYLKMPTSQLRRSSLMAQTMRSSFHHKNSRTEMIKDCLNSRRNIRNNFTINSMQQACPAWRPRETRQ